MTQKKPKRLFLKMFLTVLGLAVLAGGVVVIEGWPATGSAAEGNRLTRMQASPQWHEGKFRNALPRKDGSLWEIFQQYMRGGKGRVPTAELPIIKRSAHDFEHAPASGLRLTWLGHSTILVEMGQQRVLIDPVWSERASPSSWLGPKRFHAPPLPLAELPGLDAVVISHDHYDHLDYKTIQALSKRVQRFVVPLGVGAHLEQWGVPAAHITECDWWQETQVEALHLTAVPARHFSGRSVVMADQDRTLWAGWVLRNDVHRVYYSGDTAMFPGFADIGERLGPFDVTLIESGAYNALWADVHIGPEQAVVAHQMVRGNLLIPVHWGTFSLAMHSWTEPVERLLRAAAHAHVSVAVPRLGESVEPSTAQPVQPWWPQEPWQSAAESPLISGGLDEALIKRVRSLWQEPAAIHGK